MAEQSYRQSRYDDKQVRNKQKNLRQGHSRRSAGRRKRRAAAAGALTPEQVIRQRRRRLADRAEVGSFFTRLIFLAALLFVLFGFVFGIAPVPDDDMEPVLSAGDLVLYYRLEDSYISQDVVVWEADGEQYIGRVVARGGDTVEITEDARVKINGSTVIESNIFYSTPQYDTEVEYPLTLAADEYFILSDYRTRGKDSRYFGAVKKSEIKGILIAALRRAGL